MATDPEALPCPWCDAPLSEPDGHQVPKCAGCGREPIVCDKYRITRLLGRGGMGVVYAAKRTTDKQKVAVKIIAPPRDNDWTAWELFERSSRVLEQLHHPCLPKVYAFERTDAGRLVLVREPFGGGTLQERIEGSDERITPARLRDLLEKMLELLEYLQGLVPPVIHRDIKPSNVMFRTTSSWEPVLVDFDTIVSRRSGLTIVGTPGYAAPEQFAADATPASDVYGLGATMLFVATHTDADDLPHEHGRFKLDGLLPSLDDKLAGVLERMVEPDASKRYATARDVLRDLRHASNGAEPPKQEHKQESSAPKQESSAPKPSPPPPLRAPRPSARWLLTLPLALGWWYGGPWLWLRHVDAKHPAVETSAPSAQESQNAKDEQACKDGDNDACFTVALRYDDGTDGVTKDYAHAARVYEIACNRGHAVSCNNLGVDYQHGYGVDGDAPRAANLYDVACNLKSPLGCRNLAAMYKDDAGAVPHDLVKAFGLLTRGCDLRDGKSCNDLGWAYEAGLGTRKDVKKAANLYGQACDLGYLYGCRNYGICYEIADGVERDDQRAVVLLERACVEAEKGGCLELGRMTLQGRGTEKDPAGAAEHFRMACDDDWVEACEELGKLYALGIGVKKDVKKARKLYGRACDGGVDTSCTELKLLAP